MDHHGSACLASPVSRSRPGPLPAPHAARSRVRDRPAAHTALHQASARAITRVGGPQSGRGQVQAGGRGSQSPPRPAWRGVRVAEAPGTARQGPLEHQARACRVGEAGWEGCKGAGKPAAGACGRCRHGTNILGTAPLHRHCGDTEVVQSSQGLLSLYGLQGRWEAGSCSIRLSLAQNQYTRKRAAAGTV